MPKRQNLRAPPWTEADNERIRDFVSRGISILKAAAALKRKTDSVRTQARKIGAPFPTRREARDRFADDPASSWKFHVSLPRKRVKRSLGGDDLEPA